MNVVALIPARAGSKGIPNKNVRVVAGKPLLVHAIEHAKDARRVDRVIVSTDSEEYADLARRSGAEVPFLRPASLATDEALDLVVFQHALEWLTASGHRHADAFAHVRPTYPTRTSANIDEAIELLENQPSWTSVRSISPANVSPHKMWYLEATGGLSPVIGESRDESHSAPRQRLPVPYFQNACIDVIRTSTIAAGSMTGDVVGGYVMPNFHDIDTEAELLAIGDGMAREKMGAARRLVVDIDGVVCTIVPGNDYALAEPQPSVIAAINACYAAGHEVVLYTARGTVTSLDWESVTRAQLAAWGVRYHELRFGKPAADFYIDDKALTPSDFLRLAGTF